MKNIEDVSVTLLVSYHEARAIRSAVEAKAKKFERATGKGFVPEEGKMDRNVAGAELHRDIAAKVDQALTEALAAAKGQST